MSMFARVSPKSLALSPRLMRATLSIQTTIRQPQTLHRTSMQQVLRHNLTHILRMNKPIPDRIRIHHHYRPMLALIQAPQLIRTNLPL